MATIKPFNQKELDSAQNEQDKIQGYLDSSPTAYGGDTTPTAADVANDLKLTKLKNTINTMKGQQLKEDWYGKDSALNTTQPETATKQNQGFLNRTLTALAKPLYGIVGATEAITGQGVKDGVLDNMKENTETGHRTFGDLLGKTGAPGIISAPLGFALDVALDPVNWITAGSTAIVPKAFKGLARGTAKEGLVGGLEAAGKAITTGMGETAMDVGSLIPGVRKSSALEKLGNGVWAQNQRYAYLTGKGELEGLNKGGMEGLASLGKFNAEDGVTLGTYLEGIIASSPKGQEFLEKFKYDPHQYMQLVKIKDRVLKVMEKTDDLSTVDADVPNLISNISKGTNEFAEATSPELTKIKDTLLEGLDDTDTIANTTDKLSAIHVDNAAEFEARMMAEAEAEGYTKQAIQKYIKMNQNKTGMQFYDNLADAWSNKIKDMKVGDVKAGEAFLNTLAFANKFFKVAKVPMNPASHVNSVLGNIVMDKMAGWDVTETVPEVMKAYKFLQGKAGPQFVLDNFLQEASDYSRFVSAHPNAFKGTYGFDPSMVGGKYFLDKLLKDGRATGLITAKNEQEFLDAMVKMPDDLRAAIESAAEAASGVKGSAVEEVQKLVKDGGIMKMDTPTQMIERYAKEGVPEKAGAPSSVIQDLGITGGAGMDYIKARAEKGDVAYKLLQGLMEKSMNAFEMHDQASKLGKAIYATKTGLTEQSIQTLSRLLPGGIKKTDIVGTAVKNGQKRYRLTWDKATDLVNETNMNYSAMPAFVRMMRSVPIIGAPFVSFSYAMVPKTAKALMHNPESFNQINFMIHELSGAKTPIEKKNLESKYSQWFNSPAMLRVPFMDSHPAYVNLSNFLPYYSMSLWSQSNRNFKEVLPDTMATIVDKGQLFKDPAGQVLFDYFILPMLLDKERPMSQFGQPLYPESATTLNKIGYGARTLGEAYVPGMAGVLGLPLGAPMEQAMPGSSKYIPSYTFRKLANATAQKSPLGIPKNEGSASLVSKAISGLVGVPYDTMDITYLNNTKKKKK